MAGLNCEIRWETRLCEVDGELGYFHCWEHWSNVIDASPLRGGVIPEARLGKSMELSSLRTASGGLTLQNQVLRRRKRYSGGDGETQSRR